MCVCVCVVSDFQLFSCDCLNAGHLYCIVFPLSPPIWHFRQVKTNREICSQVFLFVLSSYKLAFKADVSVLLEVMSTVSTFLKNFAPNIGAYIKIKPYSMEYLPITYKYTSTQKRKLKIHGWKPKPIALKTRRTINQSMRDRHD